MRDDERYEIERAFDLLPHVVGSSWAVVWFRFNKIKNPTREEYREKVLEYLKMIVPVFESYPNDEKFSDIIKYIKYRKEKEFKKIISGLNPEIEKRYDRYVDYG
ncbi:MAG: hypothetical protein IIA19_07690 [Thaumarchaeota archaeon]|nr:hypothetical protein [Nitrososphaerota archaeon]